MTEYAVKITEEDIRNAETYVPLSTKENYVRAIAVLCAEPVEVKLDDTALPPMFRENKKLKAQYLMGTLAILLRQPFESEKLDGGEELTGCMKEEVYDLWAGSHVMNQLERLKKCRNGETVNRLFDLLYEYKNIEMMLTGAIRDELEVRNDPFNRAMEWFSLSAADAAVKELVTGELRDVIAGAKGEKE